LNALNVGRPDKVSEKCATTGPLVLEIPRRKSKKKD